MKPLMASDALGITALSEQPALELRSTSSDEEVTAVIRAAYRQVFGNEYLMERERLVSAESLLRQRDITVRDFIRSLALSDLYRDKFFQNAFQVRFIELNFKHLLGRAPNNEEEIAYHLDLYCQKGYEAEINSYLDSEEYFQNFGDWVVPNCRGFEVQLNQTTAAFTRMFQLYRGEASSDRKASRPRLTYDLARNTSSGINMSAGQVLKGQTAGKQASLYRVRALQRASAFKPQLRRAVQEYVVAVQNLSDKLQQLNQQNATILSVRPA
jgi:phycocyanin-associated rod linker protein